MKIRECIDRADILRPNDVPDELKVDALMRLDTELADLIDSDSHLAGDDTELIVPFPYDALYISFMKAYIDNAQEDSELYANDYAEYIADENKFKAWYSRNFQRKQISGWRV